MLSNRKLDTSHSGYGEYFESPQFRNFTRMEYELYLQPNIIKRYLNRLILLHNLEDFQFYPVTEERFINYIGQLSVKFDHNHLKYDTKKNLNNLTRIISNLGKSGLNYISSVNEVIDLNKPVLLYYGIEHLSAFYLNLHFNFTEENKKLSQIGDKLFKHGIDPYEFKKITVNVNLKTFLESKIRLTKIGLAPRYFLLLDFPLEEFFIQGKTISLIELMSIFFTKLPLGNIYKISGEFIEENKDLDLVCEEMKYSQDLDLFVLYCLSFIFSYLGRYKISLFEKVINEEKRSLGFYLRTLIRRIQDLYIRKIFSMILFNNDEVIMELRKHTKY